MQETELYALWEQHACTGARLLCRDGTSLTVIARGDRNHGAGPDYRGAVLIIGGELAVGAVEMHVGEAEWFAHGHDRDPAYQSVILHLIEHGDRREGLCIPTITAAVLAAGQQLPHPAAAANDDGGERMAPAVLAELAWVRLVRRAIEIVRAEPELGPADRVRRAFIRRLFDCLGYSGNRAAMGAVADVLLVDEARLRRASFDQTAALVFRTAGSEPDRVRAAAASFMSESRLHGILVNPDLPSTGPRWRYDTRPSNVPERRLWGGGKLMFDLYHADLLPRLLEAVRAMRLDAAIRPLRVRMGTSSFIGAERGREIVINALLPAALATGVLTADRSLVEGACRLYRDAPAAGTNAVVRAIERRYGLRERLTGAFWQQGAIEFHQRVLDPDRSRLSFIAEPIRAT